MLSQFSGSYLSCSIWRYVILYLIPDEIKMKFGLIRVSSCTDLINKIAKYPAKQPKVLQIAKGLACYWSLCYSQIAEIFSGDIQQKLLQRISAKVRQQQPSKSHNIQRSAKRLVCGCEMFVPAHAHLFCLPLHGSCLARFAYLLADLCMYLFND